ncbi:MAG: hypothetical protein M3Y41_11895, partial [Pseudomonadota bacterium]|nr:hypothetical protein [Pseudomonadota bacterium]
MLAKVEASPALVRLGQEGRGRERFSTREMLAVEQRTERTAAERGDAPWRHEELTPSVDGRSDWHGRCAD